MTWLSDNYPDSSIDDWPQATVVEADTYHSDRGNSDWTDESDATVKTQALQRAWDYLRGLNWKADVFDTELPEDVKNAQIEGALAELVSPGALSPNVSADNNLKMKNIAGVLIKEWFPGSPVGTQYATISNLLSKYLIGGTSGQNRPVIRG